MNQEHIDTIGRGWIHDVKDQVENASLARAGLAVIRLVSFALKTQHDEQLARDVDSCVKMFWARCERESQPPAAPQPMDAALEALRAQVAQANGDGLLPCPFCGGQAEADLSDSKFEYGTGGPNSVMDYGVVVYCTSCSASIGMMDVPPPDKEAAAREWNRRAPQPPAPQRWTPVKDGKTPMFLVEKGGSVIRQALSNIVLPDNYRLCRLADAAQTQEGGE